MKHNYDNRYNEGSVFASDAGRVKQTLNINKYDSDVLKSAERAQFFEDLKDSNIKFLNPEFEEILNGDQG